jgi:O-antigen ligase
MNGSYQASALPRGAAGPLALDVLLTLGLLLVTASQLRLAGSSIGPGEACLAVWIVLMLIRETSRLGPPLSPALSRLLTFWSLFAVAESVGTLAGYVIGDIHDPGFFLHDVLAYPLMAAISCLAVAEPGAAFRLRRIAWLLATLGAAFVALQLANAWELFAVADIHPWYWERLRGWAENPNQLALLCLVVAFVSLHLLETDQAIGRKIAAVACALPAIYVGRLTKSDTFLLALVAAGPVFLTLMLRSWLRCRDHKVTMRYAFAWMVMLALPIAAISLAPFSSAVGRGIATAAEGLSKADGEDAQEEALLRLSAWREAMGRGLETGMLGLGPGPHLNVPDSIVAARQQENEPENLDHPDPNGAPNFEAHNTVLDLFVQGGVIAVLSFFWLAVASLASAYRANLAALTALLIGLGVFSIFHLIIRFPLFWFAIALCLVASPGAGRLLVVHDGS